MDCDTYPLLPAHSPPRCPRGGTIYPLQRSFAPVIACRGKCVIACRGKWLAYLVSFHDRGAIGAPAPAVVYVTLGPNRSINSNKSTHKFTLDKGPLLPTHPCDRHFAAFPMAPKYTYSESVTIHTLAGTVLKRRTPVIAATNSAMLFVCRSSPSRGSERRTS